MEWHIIGTLAFVVIYNLYRYYREQKDSDYCPVEIEKCKMQECEK